MPKKGKIQAEEKIRLVQACEEGELSQTEAAMQAGVDDASIRDWLVGYRSEGRLGFLEQDQNRVYSTELKLQAEIDYLSGGGSQRKICEKYKIRSNKQLRSRIKVYTSGKMSPRQKLNEEIAEKLEEMHTESPDKGYRRLRDDLEVYHNILVNDKRVLRICRKKGIKSTIKYSNHGCTRQASNPQYIAENIAFTKQHKNTANLGRTSPLSSQNLR